MCDSFRLLKADQDHKTKISLEALRQDKRDRRTEQEVAVGADQASHQARLPGILLGDVLSGEVLYLPCSPS